MSIRLPQRMREAPLGPEASSFDGSTLRLPYAPAAAAYITTAATSRPTAATANAIAARLEIGRAPTSGGEVSVAGLGEHPDLVGPEAGLSDAEQQSRDHDHGTRNQQASKMLDGGNRSRPDEDAQSGEESDVDHDGRKEAGKERPAWHRDHPGNLAGVDPQSRDEAAPQNPEPARLPEEAACPIDRTTDVEPG